MGVGTLAANLFLPALLEAKKSSAGIEELDENGNGTGYVVGFQYFPESISDSKSVSWASKDIPGGSIPLYQWISSGARTLSFSTVFTTDIDFSQSTLSTIPEDLTGRNVDIRSAIIWLRRFLLPRYESGTSGAAVGTTLTKPPHRLRLYFPNTGIGLMGGMTTNGSTGVDYVTCIMEKCEVKWETFFPSGYPRIATVDMSFAQIAQAGGKISFPQVTDDMDRLSGKGKTKSIAVTSSGDVEGDINFFAYSIKGKKAL